ncbi:MAG TPA: type II toxin-antitoxin system PemK/MazF family toxin [Rickettsia endosymbiont of Sericostoma sp.]|uniref:type II toxin-antitoxin system PemK/MazF family toxin n=1 Tax=unclassified Candidatus Tisiphia TaxID=2996318 RepID=UPI001D24B004|nr:type II toxin-antitoxin system PemK/MazF family toxin [Rickettsia endosymbiont of Sericostoma sp. HW-2014]HJD64485.1 type II toxin-antitoxin system PemK/MazF family toxin [Rickettsia endosymbiont of Sericostoma sp.]
MVTFIPERGDVVWINFEPQKGREIQKTRPAVVLSPYKYNLKSGLALFVPITSQIKGYPFEVMINFEQIKGAVLCDQARSMDWRIRIATKILTLDKILINVILSKLRLLL